MRGEHTNAVPPLTLEDRRAALAKAAAVRKERAEVKEALKRVSTASQFTP
jgi:hypothetical protein